MVFALTHDTTTASFTLDNPVLQSGADTLEYETFDSLQGSWRNSFIPLDSNYIQYQANEAGKASWVFDIPAIRLTFRKTYFAYDALYPTIGYLQKSFSVMAGNHYKATAHFAQYADNIFQKGMYVLNNDTVDAYGPGGIDQALGVDSTGVDSTYTIYFTPQFTGDAMVMIGGAGYDTGSYIITDTMSFTRIDSFPPRYVYTYDTIETTDTLYAYDTTVTPNLAYWYDTLFDVDYTYDTLFAQTFEIDTTPWRSSTIEKDTTFLQPGIIEYDGSGQRLKITQRDFAIPIVEGMFTPAWTGVAVIDLTVERNTQYRVKFDFEKSSNIDFSQGLAGLNIRNTRELEEGGLFASGNMFEQQITATGAFVSGSFRTSSDTTISALIYIIDPKDVQTDSGYYYLDNFRLEKVTEIKCSNDPTYTTSNDSKYRFGFNGMEKDDEVKGAGNWLEFGDYGYDPRTGRRNNTDPVVKPWESGYATFGGNPIYYADPTGLDKTSTTDGVDQGQSVSVTTDDYGKKILDITVTAQRCDPNATATDNTNVAEKARAFTPRQDMIPLPGPSVSDIYHNGSQSMIDSKEPCAWTLGQLMNGIWATADNMSITGQRMQNFFTGGTMVRHAFSPHLATDVEKEDAAIGTIAAGVPFLGVEENTAVGILNPNEIHFMQSSIKNTTGEFTVLGNAEALRTGELNPEVLRMNVWKDETGKIWTLDHRRLGAFRLSGLQEAPILWTSPEGQMWKMTTINGGTSIILKLGGGKNMIIK